jgi:hypothetical protein
VSLLSSLKYSCVDNFRRMAWQSRECVTFSLFCFFTPLTRFQAVLHQLATHTLPLSFFATHYGSLTDDFAHHPNIRNMHMSTLLDDEKREVRNECTCWMESLVDIKNRSSSSCISLSTVLPQARSVLTSLISLVFPRKLLKGPMSFPKTLLASSRKNSKAGRRSLQRTGCHLLHKRTLFTYMVSLWEPPSCQRMRSESGKFWSG